LIETRKGNNMNIQYDKEADALYIKFSENNIVESEEKENNIVLDYDSEKNIVGIEILYFVKKHKQSIFPAFKEVEKAVWESNLAAG
jgi:uncharacterized protein YuzE